MFDDPKKELQKLEDQLLAAEINQETAELNSDEFEELYDRILEEFGPRERENATTESAADPLIRNFANGYGALGNDGDELQDDDEPADQPKSPRGLVILACLEGMAIAGLAAYWLIHFL